MMNNEPWDVVIPAGGTIDEEFARRIGGPHRALAPCGPDETPVLQIVVDALRASGRAGRIIAVAPDAVRDSITGVDCWLPSGPGGVENMINGLREADPGRPAMICASDLPLLTPEAVADFYCRSAPDAQIGAGLITAAEYNAAYPDAPVSTWVPLRDTGPATIGCLFRIRPSLLAENQALIDSLFAARKSQWRMARLLGPRLIGQFLTRRLTLAGLVLHMERILGYHPDIVRNVSPALAYDIDTVADFEYAHGRLRQNPKAKRDAALEP
jgi:GTP:adenosylcobinamide-phosphate guanylyltransferase